MVERKIEEGNRVTARPLIWVDMLRGIRKVRRVPVELRRARGPVRCTELPEMLPVKMAVLTQSLFTEKFITRL